MAISCAKATSLSPALFSTTTAHNNNNNNSVNFNWLPRKLECSARAVRKFGAINSESSAAAAITDGSARWLLQPIGDGDSRHIGYKVARPGAFEIASDVVTVGRVREKADLVIPVPTVSGLHARIQNTEQNLLITDLDSTNGTFIDEKRLQPGIVYGASPGNLITFGDTNLAIFRVYKLDKEEEEEYTNEPEAKAAEDEPNQAAT